MFFYSPQGKYQNLLDIFLSERLRNF